ncbi:TPA: competence type IV pilus minor pilin ComGG [Streptococcus suis]
MLLKKKVKAGILLYALLMLAVFSLLLQFYLHRQEVENRLVQVARQETTAYIMAQMVLDQVEEDLQERQAVAEKEEKEVQSTRENQTDEKPAQTSSQKKEESKLIETEGSVLFREGQTSYYVQNQQLSVLVILRDGREYRYQFGMKSRE